MTKQLEFTYTTGALTGRTYSFRGDSVKIGSANDNDLVIPDKYIQKLHAVVTQEKQGIAILNKSVVGATFVNGEKIDKCLLNDGDLIAFGGGITLKFSSSEANDTFQAPFRTPTNSAFRLQVDSGTLKWSQYDFSKDLIKVGSRRGCDLLLSGPGIDTEHFQIVAEANDFVLYNESVSGTKVNGKGVERKVLQDGDRIEIGQNMALIFSEVVTDVRLAKPRLRAPEGQLKSKRKKVGIFQNPLVIGGIVAYISLLAIVVVILVIAPKPADPDPPGGGFGFHSMARGVWITKHIGMKELFDQPVKILGKVISEDNLPYKIVSGSTLLYDSSNAMQDGGKPWPKDPPFKRTLVSDLAESKKDYDMGREYYGNKNISPEGLFSSILNFRKALAYAPSSDSTHRAAIQEELAKSEKELALLFEEHWYKAELRLRSGDAKGAREIYEFLRTLLPDENNPGNKYARDAQNRVSF